MEQQIKERKKKLTIDLWIIALVTIAVYIVYGVFGSRIMSFCKNSDISVWPRLLMAAALEFGIAGLGITIVGLMRKESFASFGKRNQSCALDDRVFSPVYSFYFPFRTI